MTPPRTSAGLLKYRPITSGSRVALVAPASPFDRNELEAGIAELRRLGFEPVYDEAIFERHPIVAGPAETRARLLNGAMTEPDIDAVIAIRGGSGSAEILPWLVPAGLRRSRTALVGYSDITAVHAYLNGHAGLCSVHGAMIEGRLARGAAGYDESSFRGSLGAAPLGEVAPDGVEIIKPGEVRGPIFGGTLVQLAASLGTPHEFLAPAGSVLFLEDHNERPYRLRRLLTQLQQAGRFNQTAGIVFGQMPRCDEPSGAVTARQVIAEFFETFRGPVLFGFPSGHTTTPLVSFPFGVDVQVIATSSDRPAMVFREAAAE